MSDMSEKNQNTEANVEESDTRLKHLLARCLACLKQIRTYFILRIIPTFTWEKTICRVIASWCITAAMILYLGTTTAEDGTDILFTNLKPFGADVSNSLLLFGIAVAFILLTVVAAYLPKYETDSWFLLLGATACVVKWLSDYKGENQFLFLLAVLVAYTLFLVYFLHKNCDLLAKWKPGKRTVIATAAACGLIGGGVIAGFTCLRYMTFSAPNFDFGLFCQMFHYMKKEGLPFITCERNVLLSHFVVHLSPIYYLILPFYAIFPSPLTLQIAQAVVVASGVIPAYLLCRHYKLGGKATMLVCLIYSLFPALAGSCFYDMHENFFLAPILLWLFWCFEAKKTLPMYICAVLLLMVKEDAAVYLVLFALYIILSRKQFKHGGILAGMALIWFGIAMSILTKTSEHYAAYYAELGVTANPSISGPMVNRFNNLMADKEDGLLGALRTALVNPGYLLTQLFTTSGNGWEKFIYVFQMILPVGFIPFCTKKASRWLLLTPWLLNLLTMYQYQYNIGFQYHFAISAFLIYAMIQNIPELKAPTRRGLLAFGAAACCCLYIITAVPKLTYYQERWENGKDTFRYMDEILDEIPEDASLCVSTMLLAHVHDRDVLYDVTYNTKTVNGQRMPVHDDVDYVVFDQRYNNTDNINMYLACGYEKDPAFEQYQKTILILRRVAPAE